MFDADDEESAQAAAFHAISGEENWKKTMAHIQNMSTKNNTGGWQMDGDEGKSFTNGMPKPKIPETANTKVLESRTTILPLSEYDGGAVTPVPLQQIAVRKFRITGKSPNPVWYYQECVQKMRNTEITWQLRTKVRDLFVSHTVAELSCDGRHEMPYDRLREMARVQWNELEEPMKALWYHRAATQPDMWMRDAKTSDVNANIPAGINPQVFETEHAIRAMLLTWHGNWGEEEEMMIAAVERHKDNEEIYVDVKNISYW